MHQGVVSHEITIEGTNEGFTLTNDQVQNTAGLPAIAKKIAGDTTRVIVTEKWTGHHATVQSTAPGKPISVSGTVSLEERDGATVEMVELEVRVKLPVIGGKLEQLMLENLAQGLAAEQAVGDLYLAG